MNLRRTETSLARFTMGCLVLYVPAETWVSYPGLLHPMYLVDVVAMVLLFFGARHSLKARPRCAPGLLAAGWAWASANGWRATSWRVLEVSDGGALDHGNAELWATGIATAISLACLAVALLVVVRSSAGEESAEELRHG